MQREVLIVSRAGASAEEAEAAEGGRHPPLGSAEEVRRRISAVLPEVDWSDPSWGLYLGEGFVLAFEPEGEPVEFVSVHVEGVREAAGLAALEQLAEANGWQVWEDSTGQHSTSRESSATGQARPSARSLDEEPLQYYAPEQSITFRRSSTPYPGRLRMSYWRWVRSFPRTLVNFFLVLLPLVGLAHWVHWAWWIAVGLVLLADAWLALRLRDQFLYGCVNPAVVVSTDPPLVAVYTDLSTRKDGPPYPVILIRSQPLARMTGGMPPVGTRLATVASYWGSGDSGHWDGFDPVVVNCVTGDRAEIERVLNEITGSRWELLEYGLRQVPTPNQPGLYPFEEESG